MAATSKNHSYVLDLLLNEQLFLCAGKSGYSPLDQLLRQHVLRFHQLYVRVSSFFLFSEHLKSLTVHFAANLCSLKLDVARSAWQYVAIQVSKMVRIIRLAKENKRALVNSSRTRIGEQIHPRA